MSSVAAPAMCAVAGGIALASYAVSAKRARMTKPTACASARRGTVQAPSGDAGAPSKVDGAVSAKLAATTTGLDDEGLWGLTPEAEAQFEGHTTKMLGANSDKVKQAKRDVTPAWVESTHTKSLGTTIPRIGCNVETKKTNVTGMMMWHMPERYADEVALLESGADEAVVAKTM